jgi:uncharacterized membrane protein YhaH (DUF805 family)
VDFALLAARKVILFLGDDSAGAYETLKRGLGIADARYKAGKLLSNLYWWLLWLGLLAAMAARRLSDAPTSPAVLLLMAATLYPLAAHSIFESNGKYHLPVAGFLLACAAIWMASAAEANQTPPAVAGAAMQGVTL